MMDAAASRSIDLSGSVNNARFEFKFTASGGGGGGLSPLSSARDGNGTLRFTSRSSSSTIRRVSVALRTGGDFEVRVLSGASESWEGRWRPDGNRQARLEVAAMGTNRASGSGQIDLDGRGSFDRVNMTGSAANASFTLDFRSGSGGGTSPRPPSNSVNDAAFRAMRQEIRRRFGNDTRSRFTSASNQFLSFSEQIVRGQGHLTESNGRVRNFDYSVKVNPSTGATRDPELRLR
jgi:hypothetical protein